MIHDLARVMRDVRASPRALLHYAQRGTEAQTRLAVGVAIGAATTDDAVAALRSFSLGDWQLLRSVAGTHEVHLLEVRAGRDELSPSSYARLVGYSSPTGATLPDRTPTPKSSSLRELPADWCPAVFSRALDSREDRLIELMLARMAEPSSARRTVEDAAEMVTSQEVLGSVYASAIVDWFGVRFVPGNTLLPVQRPWMPNRDTPIELSGNGAAGRLSGLVVRICEEVRVVWVFRRDLGPGVVDLAGVGPVEIRAVFNGYGLVRSRENDLG